MCQYGILSQGVQPFKVTYKNLKSMHGESKGCAHRAIIRKNNNNNKKQTINKTKQSQHKIS